MEEKYDLHVRVNMSTGQLISSFYRLACCKTQAEFVEKAVNFYAGYIAGNSTAEYVTTAVSESVKKTIGSFEKHMAKMLFKYSVEQAMMMNILAAYHRVERPQLDILRGECVEEINRTRGQFSLKDAMEYQNNE